MKFFTKVLFLRVFWKKLKNLNFRKKCKGPGSCSTSYRAGTRLTVHRALPYQNSSEAGQTGRPHADALDHEKVVFKDHCSLKVLGNLHNKFKLSIEASDGAS